VILITRKYGTNILLFPQGQVNFSTSVLVFNENLRVGAGINHLLQMNSSLAEDPAYMPLRFITFGGITLNVPGQYRNRDDQSVSLACQFRHQASVNQLDLGAYYFREPFGVGIWYRGMPSADTPWNRDALFFSAIPGYDQLFFSYSYDMTISSMIQSTGGAHEIAVH
jgi:hypothetical protein